MVRKIVATLTIILIIVVFSCKPVYRNQESNKPDVLVSHIDSTIKPGDDFFMFANGKWFKEHPIPPSEQSNGLWQLIRDTINSQVFLICKSSAEMNQAVHGSNKQKIGDFYFSGMDSLSLNKNGIADLKNDLRSIDQITDIAGIVKEASYIHMVAASPMMTFGISPDLRNSNKNAVYIFQGGLSLPDRRYYFDTDQRCKIIREKFAQHLENSFRIIGYNDATAKQAAQNIFKLETSLAKSSRKREDTRDPIKNYNKLTYKALTALTPNFDWNIYFKEAGFSGVDSVIICQPEFFSDLNLYLKSFPLSCWKDYLKYQLLCGLSDFVDDSTYYEFFNFYNKVLLGIEEPKPRWKRVVEMTNYSLDDLIGQVYVTEYLPKHTKEKLLEIGNAIKSIYADRIKNLDWMSEPTKLKALKKLDAIIMKIGYPDKWKDMSAIEIDRKSYVINVMNAVRWKVKFNYSKYGQPVDRTEWQMEPQTYNAYYNPSNNEIVIPGCNIIIPGFEHKMADDAILYSVIGGSTFGHEITHGFDDQGSKYDMNGNLNNWWTKDDSIKFYSKTKLIVKQFDKYIAIDSLHINGELTQGENIADLAGVAMGYQAFKKTELYKHDIIIGGLNPEQRYFLGYAMAWMVNERPEVIANQIKSDEHSPVKFRVNGPLSNLPEFYKAFCIKEGDAMWRPDSLRVNIW